MFGCKSIAHQDVLDYHNFNAIFKSYLMKILFFNARDSFNFIPKIQCSIAVSLEELEAEWNWSSGYHLCELEKFLSIAHLSGGEVEDSWMKMVWNSFDSSTIDPVRKIGMLSKQGISALSRKICLWNVHFHTKRLINSQEWAWWLKSTTKPLLSFQPQKQFSW